MEMANQPQLIPQVFFYSGFKLLSVLSLFSGQIKDNLLAMSWKCEHHTELVPFANFEQLCCKKAHLPISQKDETAVCWRR